jgi:transposase
MGDLIHSGTPHEGAIPHSGRYAFGSGKNPYQSDKTGFYKEYKLLKDKGLSEKKIAKHFDDKYYGGQGYFNTTNLRAYITIGKEQQDKANIDRVVYLKNHRKMSVKAISEEMGVPERTVYSWL